MYRMSTAMTALAALMLSAPATAKNELIFNAFAPPQHLLNTQIISPWIDAVKKATDGRVAFTIPNSSLAPPPRQFDIVRTGVADAAYQMNAFLKRRVPLIQVTMLPLLYTSAEAHAVAMWRTHEKFFKPKDQYRGVVLLGYIASPAGHLCSMKDPIRTVEELQRMKMWTLPGAPSEALGRLNVVVVPGPAVRAHEIVSKGIVDGLAGLAVADTARLRVIQYAKSCTIIPGGIFTPNFSVLMNPKRWAALSEKDRAAVMTVSGEALARRSSVWESDNAKIEASAKVPTETASDAFMAALRKAWTPMHDEWVAEANKLGIDGKAALEYFIEQASKVHAESQKK